MKKIVCVCLLAMLCPQIFPARNHDKVALTAFVDEGPTLGVLFHLSKRFFIRPGFGIYFPETNDTGISQFSLKLGLYYIWLMKENYRVYSGAHLKWEKNNLYSSNYNSHKLFTDIVTGIRFPISKRVYLFGETAISYENYWSVAEHETFDRQSRIIFLKTSLGIIFFL